MRSQLTRRRILQGLMSAAVLLTVPMQVFARMAEAFTAKEKDIVLRQLIGEKPVIESDRIKFKIPDIAENGAVVPVSVATDIEGVVQISIVIDENPTPLSAVFHLTPNVVPDVSTRVKIGKSSLARALVSTADTVYMSTKEVKVTIGGCGG